MYGAPTDLLHCECLRSLKIMVCNEGRARAGISVYVYIRRARLAWLIRIDSIDTYDLKQVS